MLRYLTAGESHGTSLTAIVEGAPAGLGVTADEINRHLARRWLGFGRGGRAKFERDQIEILSGVRFGVSMGSPITLQLTNNAHSQDRAGWGTVMSVEPVSEDVEKITLPRPGHADLVGTQKYHFDDIRPVIERASARETAIRVAACTIARQLLEALGVQVGSHVLRIGGVRSHNQSDLTAKRVDLCTRGAIALSNAADDSETRMIDPELTERTIEHIKKTKKEGDSLGGVYEVVVTGLIAGLGSYVHWDQRLDSQLGGAILSIQGQKGVEIGDGVAGADLVGSEVHDPIVLEDHGMSRSSNRAGGLEGGVTTGMPLLVRGYMKPIPTLIKPLGTVDIQSAKSEPTRYERSDVTSVPAASTVAESVVAMVLANAVLAKFGGDTMSEIVDRYSIERNRQRSKS